MAEQTFTVYTDPHVATVGNEQFGLEPEVETPLILDGLAALRRKRREREAARAESVEGFDDLSPIEKMALDSKEATADLREFLASMMTPDSQERFAATKMSDRVLIELQNWALEVYGMRPTGSSSDSAEPSATTPDPGSDSTDTSPSEA